MSYIQDNLTVGEEIRHLAVLHWIMFIRPAVFLTLVLLMLGSGGDETLRAFTPFLIFGLLYIGLRFVTFKTSEFGLTNKRLIIKVGFIKRRTLEMVLPKIETIAVQQGILGRMLNYGTIVVVGSGGTREPFKKIAAPLEFRKQVLTEIGDLNSKP